MPWEKAFNEEAAVASAMTVFWQKGFKATSITDLLNAVGLSKGSFYNAFGSKKALFLRALQKYETEKRRAFLSQLESLDDPMQAISDFFDLSVHEMLSDKRHKGCFLINTSLDLMSHDQQVQDIVKTGMQEIESFFERNLRQAQAHNCIHHTINCDNTAKALLSFAVSIRVLGKGALDEYSLRTLAQEAKALLKPA